MYRKGFTNMAQAFIKADELLMRGRGDAQSVVTIITDGKPSFKFQTEQEVNKLKDAGVVINIVLIHDDEEGDEQELMRNWVTEPVDTHFFHINGLQALKADQSEGNYVTDAVTHTCARAMSPEQTEAAAETLGWELIYENHDCPAWWWYMGRHDNVEDCQAAAREEGANFFVYGKGPYDYWGGACFGDEANDGTCSWGWWPSSFDAYKLVGGAVEESSEAGTAFLQGGTAKKTKNGVDKNFWNRPEPKLGKSGRSAMTSEFKEKHNM